VCSDISKSVGQIEASKDDERKHCCYERTRKPICDLSSTTTLLFDMWLNLYYREKKKQFWEHIFCSVLLNFSSSSPVTTPGTSYSYSYNNWRQKLNLAVWVKTLVRTIPFRVRPFWFNSCKQTKIRCAFKWHTVIQVTTSFFFFGNYHTSCSILPNI